MLIKQRYKTIPNFSNNLQYSIYLSLLLFIQYSSTCSTLLTFTLLQLEHVCSYGLLNILHINFIAMVHFDENFLSSCDNCQMSHKFKLLCNILKPCKFSSFSHFVNIHLFSNPRILLFIIFSTLT